MKNQHMIVVFAGLCLISALGGCGGSDGDDGSDGANSLVKTSGINTGTTCPSGGTRIDSGVDTNGNGTLDSGEITSTEVICNGDGVIGWLDDKPLEELDTFAGYADVAVNTAGEAVAVWSQDDDGDSSLNLRARRYTPGQGWGAVRTVASGSNAVFPAVGLDDAGNAIVVWRQDDDDSDDAFDTRASRYNVDADSWSNPTTIDNLDGFVSPPQLALNADGDAIAAWIQQDGSGFDSVFANHFSPGNGWKPAPRTLESTGTDAHVVDLAINAQGNAVAAWAQVDSSESDGYTDIRTNRYDALADAWSSGATTIDVPNAGNAAAPAVAINDQERIMVVWRQGDGTRDNIRANEYDPGSGAWDFPDVRIEEGDGGAFAPDVALDDSGRAVAVWAQDSDTTNNEGIRSNRHTTRKGWGNQATSIQGINGTVSTAPLVGLDDAGHAVAVWGFDDGASEDIWSNQAQAGVAWGIAHLLETRDQGDAGSLAIAVTPDGDAAAVWQQEDGSNNNIRTARFRKD